MLRAKPLGLLALLWVLPLRYEARSELAFRVPDDLDLSSGDPLEGGSFDIGLEDDLFCAFMDIEKIGCRLEGSGSGSEGGVCRDRAAESSEGGEDRKIGNAAGMVPVAVATLVSLVFENHGVV